MTTAKVKKTHNLSYPAGILLAPVIIVVSVLTCLFACVVIVGAALIGKLTVTY